MNNANTISVIVAVIAALSSLFIAGISYLSARKNERDLESLRAELAERQAENNARRDYLYEARKRLYQEYEPLLFQLIELSETALSRIHALARRANQGYMGPSGWLSYTSPPNDYYLTETIYRLLAPLAIVRIIQNRLTFVDLTVDPNINRQYALIKRLYISFHEDFELAGIKPSLTYDPNNKKWLGKQTPYPEEEYYWPQGIVAGKLDRAAEALIIRESNEIVRYMSFGEFEGIYGDPVFNTFRDLFVNFHPKSRPVLWRILITQAHIYKALLDTRQMQLSASDDRVAPPLLKPLSEEDRRKFDWRLSKEATDQQVLSEPFEAAFAYLQKYLGSLLAI